MRQERRAAFDRRVVAELQFRRAGACREALQPAADAGGELARVPEAHRPRRIARGRADQRCSGAAVQVDQHDRAFRLALLRVGEHLARPLRQPAVGQFDLPDRHRVGIGQAQQQRMAIGRIARDADGVRRQFVGHRGDGTIEDLGQPVVRVELLPQRRRRGPARERMHEHQLLADIESALEELGLDALQIGIAFEQRLKAGRIQFPERVPQRDGLVGGVELAIRGGLRLAREPSRQFRMQVRDLVAHDFGDRRALAGRERRLGHRPQLAVDGRVQRAHAGHHQRLRPALGAVGVRERERRDVPLGSGPRAWRQYRGGRVLRHGLAGVDCWQIRYERPSRFIAQKEARLAAPCLTDPTGGRAGRAAGAVPEREYSAWTGGKVPARGGGRTA